MSSDTQERGVAISQNYKALFHPWELRDVKVIIRKARLKSISLRSEDFDDLLQECLIHWIVNRRHFKSKKGFSIRTYMDQVIKNRLSDLVRKIETNKRKISYLAEGFKQIEIEEDRGNTNLEQILVDCDVFERISLSELPSVLSCAMSHLSFRQKKICSYLMEGLNQTQACKKMKMPRTTLQEEIKRIREVFERYGLEEYLI